MRIRGLVTGGGLGEECISRDVAGAGAEGW